MSVQKKLFAFIAKHKTIIFIHKGGECEVNTHNHDDDGSNRKFWDANWSNAHYERGLKPINCRSAQLIKSHDCFFPPQFMLAGSCSFWPFLTFSLPFCVLTSFFLHKKICASTNFKGKKTLGIGLLNNYVAHAYLFFFFFANIFWLLILLHHPHRRRCLWNFAFHSTCFPSSSSSFFIHITFYVTTMLIVIAPWNKHSTYSIFSSICSGKLNKPTILLAADNNLQIKRV